MKKILIILGLCLLGGYLIFAGIFFEKKPQEQICNKFEIEIENETDEKFIDVADLEKFIAKQGLNPYGKQINEINTLAIQEALISNQMLKSAEVFVTSGGGIRAVVKQKTPILRVIASTGENYYIDKDGAKMPTSSLSTIYLPVATGNIKEEFAKTELYKFALFLQENDFWDAQIEQIVVQSEKDVILISRIGDQEILMGNLENYESKLNRLKEFYNKVLPSTGWNRYSTLNLKYDKQVVGTKR